jgi:hypothetical protein
VGCQVVTRRNGHRGQDLALALARLEAVFGPVQVLQIRRNPRLAAPPCRDGTQAGDAAPQGALDLDPRQREGGEAVA